MRLTSSVKELEAILQKLIKSEPGLVNNDDEKHLMTLMAMRMNFLRSRGLGATTETMVLTRKNEKIKPFESLSKWFKRKFIKRIL